MPCIISRPAHQRKAPTPTIGINTAMSCKRNRKGEEKLNQSVHLFASANFSKLHLLEDTEH